MTFSDQPIRSDIQRAPSELNEEPVDIGMKKRGYTAGVAPKPGDLRAMVNQQLQSAGVSDEVCTELLCGWNDPNDQATTCERLLLLGVNWAFVEEHRLTYFNSNVYDTIRPKLESHLQVALKNKDAPLEDALRTIIANFDKK